nr:MAG TPA: hypothetical protein [Caudoviricetes sp.]
MLPLKCTRFFWAGFCLCPCQKFSRAPRKTRSARPRTEF